MNLIDRHIHRHLLHLQFEDDISFQNMKRAIIYGSALASFCVEKFGTARLKALMPSQIEQRLQELATF